MAFKSHCLGLLLLLAAASTLAQVAENGFRFNDPADQAGFIEAVRRSGVKFSVRDDGTLTYSPADDAQVTQIRNKFLEDNFSPSSHFPNPMLEAKVIAAFDASKIPYGVRLRGGERYITWSKDDDKQAAAIIATQIEAWVKNELSVCP